MDFESIVDGSYSLEYVSLWFGRKLTLSDRFDSSHCGSTNGFALIYIEWRPIVQVVEEEPVISCLPISRPSLVSHTNPV